MLIHAAGYDPTTSEHWFYNHTERLVFGKKTWTYYRIMPDGSRQPLDGVTKVAHIIDRSEALVPWAVKKAMEKLKRLLLETTHPDCDGNVFIGLFEAELDKRLVRRFDVLKDPLDYPVLFLLRAVQARCSTRARRECRAEASQ